MRFIVLVKATKDSEAGVMPKLEQLQPMGEFNDEMTKAGVMLDGAGLVPTSRGTRIKFSGGKVTVIDGPFTEAKELVAGYWLIDVKSHEEAVAWMRRAPFDRVQGEGEIEIRRLYTDEDFA